MALERARWPEGFAVLMVVRRRAITFGAVAGIRPSSVSDQLRANRPEDRGDPVPGYPLGTDSPVWSH